MAEVYWIHTKDHTDVFSSGYVGFTSRTSAERFEEHLSESNQKNKKKLIIHKAILKYGDDIVLDVLVKCDDAYGLWLEEKLRPTDKIGWNITKGGSKPPSPVGRKATAAQRKAASERMKNSGVRPISDAATKAKIKETKVSNGPWNNRPSENLLRFWAKADLIYLLYNKFPNIPVGILCETIQEPESRYVHDVVRYMREQKFNPIESIAWQRDFTLNNTKEVEELTEVALFVKIPHYKHNKASSMWVLAKDVYNLLIKNPSLSMFSVNKQYNLPDKSIATLYKKIKSGWNPLTDEKYLNWLEEYNKQKECNESTFAT